MHGLLGTSDNWRTHAKYWSAHFTVHALDQRNHGKSFHSTLFNYQLLAADVIAYMDAHNIDRATVLGHSMGGKTAMTLALLYPERLTQLIVADIAPKTYDVAQKFSAIIEGMLHINRMQLTSRNNADEALKTFVPQVGVRQFLLKNLAWTAEKKLLKLRCNIEALAARLLEIGAAPPKGVFKGKTLFLAGAQSDYVSEDDLDEIKKYFPNNQVVKIPNAGHWLHAENPKGFTDALHAFLEITTANN